MASNSKDSKIKEFKFNAQEFKTSNLNNFLYLDQKENIKTCNKAKKKKKKY